MTHLWVRAEQRPNEDRTGLTPEGAAHLIDKGIKVTVEESRTRIIPIDGYRKAGCAIAPENSWPDAPRDAIIFGLKELPEDGTLYDLEYLVDEQGRRVAAFGYWAGYAGAAVSLMAWAAQKQGSTCPPVSAYPDKDALLQDLAGRLDDTGQPRPTAIVIGALGRVGTGAADLCEAMNVQTTRWDMAETASGGPFPKILQHDIFLNCIFARPGTPVFVPQSAVTTERSLSVIGDVACDPDSDYNPVPVYNEATTWDAPATRVHDTPPLDVMAIDNLPSLLPLESSHDYAGQLLPSLLTLDDLGTGVWAWAEATFNDNIKEV